jgi:hypothetical protein
MDSLKIRNCVVLITLGEALPEFNESTQKNPAVASRVKELHGHFSGRI